MSCGGGAGGFSGGGGRAGGARLPQGPGPEHGGQIRPPAGGEHRHIHISAGQEHLPQEIRPLADAGGPHGGAQVGRVDEQPHIALEEGAAHGFGRVRHLLEVGPIQHEVGPLGVVPGVEGLPGAEHRLAEGLGKVPQAVPLEGVPEPGGAPPAALHEHPIRLGPDGGGLHQHLGVVVVVFHLEELHHPPVGGGGGQLPVQGRPCLGQQVVQSGVGEGGQLLIAALGEDLDGLLVGAGVQHPLHPLPGHQPGLHDPHPGGQGQIIGISNLRQASASLLLEGARQSKSTLATSRSVSPRIRRTRVSKLQLTSTSPSLRISPPWMGRVCSDRVRCPSPSFSLARVTAALP